MIRSYKKIMDLISKNAAFAPRIPGKIYETEQGYFIPELSHESATGWHPFVKPVSHWDIRTYRNSYISLWSFPVVLYVWRKSRITLILAATVFGDREATDQIERDKREADALAAFLFTSGENQVDFAEALFPTIAPTQKQSATEYLNLEKAAFDLRGSKSGMAWSFLLYRFLNEAKAMNLPVGSLLSYL